MPIYLSLRVDVVSVKSVSGMLENLHKLGIKPVRRVNSRGTFNPHLSIRFGEHKFNIDSTRSRRRDIDDGCYLITHAHSDHYGKSAMLSKRAYASDKTARALELRYGNKFMGTTFAVGDTVDIDGVAVDTYHTYHTLGSTAFSWISDNGSRVLVTGDVKNAKDLPNCDVLVTEANYGDPEDPACHFEDDIMGFNNALKHNVAFGAYAFGKAQRAVEMLLATGYDGAIGMNDEIRALTSELMDIDSDKLIGINEGATIQITTPRRLHEVKSDKKYVLTARDEYQRPTIQISDHLDSGGLLRMVKASKAEVVIVYHPEGTRAGVFAKYLNKYGIQAMSLYEIE